MTSASELFYNRRSRLSRDTVELGLDSSAADRNLHQNQYNRRHHGNISSTTRRDRHDLDGCDLSRRSPHLRHSSHRSTHLGHESVRFDQIVHQSTSESNINRETITNFHNRLRVRGNDQLPGAVVLARERLLQRLRGVALPENRSNNGASSGLHRSDLTSGNASRSLDGGDWGPEGSMDAPARFLSFSGMNSQTDGILIRLERSKRSPGLSKEVIDGLRVEVFSSVNCNGSVIMESRECSICLESVSEGDKLTCLPCGHRFHTCCLLPWVRICGDCPYCRTAIVL